MVQTFGFLSTHQTDRWRLFNVFAMSDNVSLLSVLSSMQAKLIADEAPPPPLPSAIRCMQRIQERIKDGSIELKQEPHHHRPLIKPPVIKPVSDVQVGSCRKAPPGQKKATKLEIKTKQEEKAEADAAAYAINRKLGAYHRRTMKKMGFENQSQPDGWDDAIKNDHDHIIFWAAQTKVVCNYYTQFANYRILCYASSEELAKEVWGPPGSLHWYYQQCHDLALKLQKGGCKAKGPTFMREWPRMELYTPDSPANALGYNKGDGANQYFKKVLGDKSMRPRSTQRTRKKDPSKGPGPPPPLSKKTRRGGGSMC